VRKIAERFGVNPGRFSASAALSTAQASPPHDAYKGSAVDRPVERLPYVR
jgi:hypothetical protein